MPSFQGLRKTGSDTPRPLANPNSHIDLKRLMGRLCQAYRTSTINDFPDQTIRSIQLIHFARQMHHQATARTTSYRIHQFHFNLRMHQVRP